MASELHVEIKGIQNMLRKLNAISRPEVIKKALFEGATIIAGWSKTRRLTGPRPQFLGVRSGRLRSSITASKTEQRGNVFVAKIGTNVKYGRVHEEGFSGAVSIRSFVRRSRSGTHIVKAHIRKMNLRARPFLKPAINDEGNKKEVLNILTENINEAMNKA